MGEAEVGGGGGVCVGGTSKEVTKIRFSISCSIVMTSRETFRTKSIATTWSRHVETIREEEKKRIQTFF